MATYNNVYLSCCSDPTVIIKPCSPIIDELSGTSFIAGYVYNDTDGLCWSAFTSDTVVVVTHVNKTQTYATFSNGAGSSCLECVNLYTSPFYTCENLPSTVSKCAIWEISSLDFVNATGNTDPTLNGVVFVNYTACDGVEVVKPYTSNVIESDCVLEQYTILIFYFQDNVAVTTGLNSTFSSGGDCECVCGSCPQCGACSSTQICLNTGGLLPYDGTFIYSGFYNGKMYYQGNGAFIFFDGDKWCLSQTLGGQCILFGRTPCSSACPDICDEELTLGPCDTTSGICATFDFEALFDCIDPTTTTTTFLITFTPTPTNTPTPACNMQMIAGIRRNRVVVTTTTTEIIVCDDDCFYGEVVYTLFDDIFRCATTRKLIDCITGDEYYVVEPIEISGQTIGQDVTLLVVIDGVERCVTYDGPSTISSNAVLDSVINIIVGCQDCEITPTPTPTPTATVTPTETALCVTLTPTPTPTLTRTPVSQNIPIPPEECITKTPTATPTVTATLTPTPTLTCNCYEFYYYVETTTTTIINTTTTTLSGTTTTTTNTSTTTTTTLSGTTTTTIINTTTTTFNISTTTTTIIACGCYSISIPLFTTTTTTIDIITTTTTIDCGCYSISIPPLTTTTTINGTTTTTTLFACGCYSISVPLQPTTTTTTLPCDCYLIDYDSGEVQCILNFIDCNGNQATQIFGYGSPLGPIATFAICSAVLPTYDSCVISPPGFVNITLQSQCVNNDCFVPCFCYNIDYNIDITLGCSIVYEDCNGVITVLTIQNSSANYNICARNQPVITCGFGPIEPPYYQTVTLIGDCINGGCVTTTTTISTMELNNQLMPDTCNVQYYDCDGNLLPYGEISANTIYHVCGVLPPVSNECDLIVSNLSDCRTQSCPPPTPTITRTPTRTPDPVCITPTPTVTITPTLTKTPEPTPVCPVYTPTPTPQRVTPTPTITRTPGPTPITFQSIRECCTGTIVGYWNGTPLTNGVYYFVELSDAAVLGFPPTIKLTGCYELFSSNRTVNVAFTDYALIFPEFDCEKCITDYRIICATTTLPITTTTTEALICPTICNTTPTSITFNLNVETSVSTSIIGFDGYVSTCSGGPLGGLNGTNQIFAPGDVTLPIVSPVSSTATIYHRTISIIVSFRIAANTLGGQTVVITIGEIEFGNCIFGAYEIPVPVGGFLVDTWFSMTVDIGDFTVAKLGEIFIYANTTSDQSYQNCVNPGSESCAVNTCSGNTYTPTPPPTPTLTPTPTTPICTCYALTNNDITTSCDVTIRDCITGLKTIVNILPQQTIGVCSYDYPTQSCCTALVITPNGLCNNGQCINVITTTTNQNTTTTTTPGVVTTTRPTTTTTTSVVGTTTTRPTTTTTTSQGLCTNCKIVNLTISATDLNNPNNFAQVVEFRYTDCSGNPQVNYYGFDTTLTDSVCICVNNPPQFVYFDDQYNQFTATNSTWTQTQTNCT